MLADIYYITSGCCLEGVKALTVEADNELEQIIIDLLGFFHVFAKHVQDYFDAEGFTGLQGRRIPKHVSASSLTIVPKQEGFKGKTFLGFSERYIRMKEALQNKELPAIASNMIYAAKTFKGFTVPLQERQPMVIVLYQKLTELVKMFKIC